MPYCSWICMGLTCMCQNLYAAFTWCLVATVCIHTQHTCMLHLIGACMQNYPRFAIVVPCDFPTSTWKFILYIHEICKIYYHIAELKLSPICCCRRRRCRRCRRRYSAAAMTFSLNFRILFSLPFSLTHSTHSNTRSHTRNNWKIHSVAQIWSLFLL